MKLRTLLPAAVALAALATPAAASADSIVYLDGGNVWSASADGAKKVQLTDGGNWASATQADDGTIAASRNLGTIEVLARDGRPLRTITTSAARTGNGGVHRGMPINLAFSPDGRTIAYEYFDVTCPPASSCPSEQHSVLYTSADGPTATPKETYGQQFGRQQPSFVTNGRALVFGGSGAWVNLDDLGGGDSSNALWFNGNGTADFSDGEVSRDGSRLALNVGHGDETRIGFFRVQGDPRTSIPAAPTPDDTVCGSTPDAKNGGSSWSPDGNALAYHSSKGIEIVRFSAFTPGRCDVAGESVLTATGSEPDWGPADPPAARWTPGAGGTPQGQPAAPGAPTPPRPGAGAPAGPSVPAPQTPLRVTAGGAAKLRFRGTITTTCAAPGATACAATATVRIGRRTHRAAVRGTAGPLRIRFGRTATAAIRRATRAGTAVRATVVVTATAADGRKGTARRTIRLTR
jgi:hypothetical protein